MTIGTAGPRPACTASTTAGSLRPRARARATTLLDRYGNVDEDGTYSSPIENQTRRFFTMLGTLVQGRISVAGGAGARHQVALTIAIRYGEPAASSRAPGGDREVRILDYLAHQRKLLPALATTYALHFAQDELVAAAARRARPPRDGDRSTSTGSRELEARAAGIKAIAHLARHRARSRPAARPAAAPATSPRTGCPALKADTDVFTTFEGDNTVLLQLVAKELLTDYRDEFGELDTLGTVALRRRPGRRDGHRAHRRPRARSSG